jgi:hypothetical protein
MSNNSKPYLKTRNIEITVQKQSTTAQYTQEPLEILLSKEMLLDRSHAIGITILCLSARLDETLHFVLYIYNCNGKD